MRFPGLALLSCALLLPLAACESSNTSDAPYIGVLAKIEQMPSVSIDDENGTEVRVFVDFEHWGGPDTQTFEVVSASLGLDLEHYADIELAIPDEHPQFTGLVEGEDLGFELRGTIPDTHEDWGLCSDPQGEEADGERLTLDLVLRVTPGANDEADEFVFQALAVTLGCSFTG